MPRSAKIIRIKIQIWFWFGIKHALNVVLNSVLVLAVVWTWDSVSISMSILQWSLIAIKRELGTHVWHDLQTQVWRSTVRSKALLHLLSAYVSITEVINLKSSVWKLVQAVAVIFWHRLLAKKRPRLLGHIGCDVFCRRQKQECAVVLHGGNLRRPNQCGTHWHHAGESAEAIDMLQVWVTSANLKSSQCWNPITFFFWSCFYVWREPE